MTILVGGSCACPASLLHTVTVAPASIFALRWNLNVVSTSPACLITCQPLKVASLLPLLWTRIKRPSGQTSAISKSPLAEDWTEKSDKEVSELSSAIKEKKKLVHFSLYIKFWLIDYIYVPLDSKLTHFQWLNWSKI